MKKIIFTAFAVDNKKQTSVNACKNKHFLDSYYEDVCVTLISAKKNNPDTDVALVTNVPVPEKYRVLLERNDLLIFQKENDSFLFPYYFKWGLAFYKLCALKHVVEKLDYDLISMVDCDVYIQDSFENIWKESENNILLYDICHGLQVADYRTFLSNVKQYYGDEKIITHYGGEFISGTRKMLLPFVNTLQDIHESFRKNKYVIECGDEAITSIAANLHKEEIKNASAYIYRFWTGPFRLVSTCYVQNSVTILHLPDEKNKGLHKLYKLLEKNKRISKRKVYRICHLVKPSFTTLVKIYIKRLLKRKTA